MPKRTLKRESGTLRVLLNIWEKTDLLVHMKGLSEAEEKLLTTSEEQT